MHKKIFFGLVTFLLASTNGFANHGSRGSGHLPNLEEKYFDKAKFLMKHQEELGLTAEQLQRLEAKKFDVKRVLIEADAQKDIAMLNIYQELHADKPNPEKLNAALDEKIEAKRSASRVLIEALLDLKSVLTAEQTAKSKKMYLKEKFSKSSHCSICSAKDHHKSHKGH